MIVSGRLVVCAEVLGDLVVPDPVDPRQDGRADRSCALLGLQESLGRVLVVGPRALPDRAAVDVVLHPVGLAALERGAVKAAHGLYPLLCSVDFRARAAAIKLGLPFTNGIPE
jgi:hypothetical protein